MNRQHSNICIAMLCMATALIAGCGSVPGARDVPPGANFVANILDDGTKLFTFSTRLPRPAGGGPGGMRGGGGGGMAGDEEGEARRRMHASMGESSKKALQVMLQENGYCREGYVLHELYEDRTDYVIRGECRDAATDADRARFSHK